MLDDKIFQSHILPMIKLLINKRPTSVVTPQQSVSTESDCCCLLSADCLSEPL